MHFLSCSVTCTLADGKRCEVSNAVKLHVKVLSFSWNHEFKVLGGGPFPAIFGLDFVRRTKKTVDVATGTFSFGFAPHCSGTFSPPNAEIGKELFLQNLWEEVSYFVVDSEACISSESFDTMVAEFPAFSLVLGTANCTPYDIELSDTTSVRSQPYKCAPPKLAVFRRIMDELLEQGVVRPSRSPYVSPAFLVPKSGGNLRLVVEYRKVNTRVAFDSYPMPTIEQAFEQFGELLCSRC